MTGIVVEIGKPLLEHTFAQQLEEWSLLERIIE
jgi:hypothetical protein